MANQSGIISITPVLNGLQAFKNQLIKGLADVQKNAKVEIKPQFQIDPKNVKAFEEKFVELNQVLNGKLNKVDLSKSLTSVMDMMSNKNTSDNDKLTYLENYIKSLKDVKSVLSGKQLDMLSGLDSNDIVNVFSKIEDQYNKVFSDINIKDPLKTIKKEANDIVLSVSDAKTIAFNQFNSLGKYDGIKKYIVSDFDEALDEVKDLWNQLLDTGNLPKDKMKDLIGYAAKLESEDLDKFYEQFGERNAGEIEDLFDQDKVSKDLYNQVTKGWNEFYQELSKAEDDQANAIQNMADAGIEQVQHKVTVTSKKLQELLGLVQETDKAITNVVSNAANVGADKLQQSLDKFKQTIKDSLSSGQTLGNYKNYPSDVKNITGIGAQNYGVIQNDNYTAIQRDIQYAPKIKDLTGRLEEAYKAGANVARIVDSIEDKATGTITEIQETAPGKNIAKSNEYLQATDEQVQKLVDDLKVLKKVGLSVDIGGDNILYDKNKGFSFIDLAHPLTPNNYTTQSTSGLENYFSGIGADSNFINKMKSADAGTLISSQQQAVNAVNATNDALKQQNDLTNQKPSGEDWFVVAQKQRQQEIANVMNAELKLQATMEKGVKYITDQNGNPLVFYSGQKYSPNQLNLSGGSSTVADAGASNNSTAYLASNPVQDAKYYAQSFGTLIASYIIDNGKFLKLNGNNNHWGRVQNLGNGEDEWSKQAIKANQEITNAVSALNDFYTKNGLEKKAFNDAGKGRSGNVSADDFNTDELKNEFSKLIDNLHDANLTYSSVTEHLLKNGHPYGTQDTDSWQAWALKHGYTAGTIYGNIIDDTYNHQPEVALNDSKLLANTKLVTNRTKKTIQASSDSESFLKQSGYTKEEVKKIITDYLQKFLDYTNESSKTISPDNFMTAFMPEELVKYIEHKQSGQFKYDKDPFIEASKKISDLFNNGDSFDIDSFINQLTNYLNNVVKNSLSKTIDTIKSNGAFQELPDNLAKQVHQPGEPISQSKHLVNTPKTFEEDNGLSDTQVKAQELQKELENIKRSAEKTGTAFDDMQGAVATAIEKWAGIDTSKYSYEDLEAKYFKPMDEIFSTSSSWEEYISKIVSFAQNLKSSLEPLSDTSKQLFDSVNSLVEDNGLNFLSKKVGIKNTLLNSGNIDVSNWGPNEHGNLNVKIGDALKSGKSSEEITTQILQYYDTLINSVNTIKTEEDKVRQSLSATPVYSKDQIKKELTDVYNNTGFVSTDKAVSLFGYEPNSNEANNLENMICRFDESSSSIDELIDKIANLYETVNSGAPKAINSLEDFKNAVKNATKPSDEYGFTYDKDAILKLLGVDENSDNYINVQSSMVDAWVNTLDADDFSSKIADLYNQIRQGNELVEQDQTDIQNSLDSTTEKVKHLYTILPIAEDDTKGQYIYDENGRVNGIESSAYGTYIDTNQLKAIEGEISTWSDSQMLDYLHSEKEEIDGITSAMKSYYEIYTIFAKSQNNEVVDSALAQLQDLEREFPQIEEFYNNLHAVIHDKDKSFINPIVDDNEVELLELETRETEKATSAEQDHQETAQQVLKTEQQITEEKRKQAELSSSTKSDSLNKFEGRINDVINSGFFLKDYQFMKSDNIQKVDYGHTNFGVAQTDEYTAIQRKDEYLPKVKDLQEKLKAAADEGANVAQILDVIEDKTGKTIFEIQQTAPGKNLEQTTEYLKATDEQIQKLADDVEILKRNGLFVDLKKENLLYDKEKGFSFIDLSTHEKPGYFSDNMSDIASMFDNSAFSDKLLRASQGSNNTTRIEESQKNVNSGLEIQLELDREISAEEDRIADTKEKIAQATNESISDNLLNFEDEASEKAETLHDKILKIIGVFDDVNIKDIDNLSNLFGIDENDITSLEALTSFYGKTFNDYENNPEEAANQFENFAAHLSEIQEKANAAIDENIEKYRQLVEQYKQVAGAEAQVSEEEQEKQLAPFTKSYRIGLMSANDYEIAKINASANIPTKSFDSTKTAEELAYLNGFLSDISQKAQTESAQQDQIVDTNNRIIEEKNEQVPLIEEQNQKIREERNEQVVTTSTEVSTEQTPISQTIEEKTAAIQEEKQATSDAVASEKTDFESLIKPIEDVTYAVIDKTASIDDEKETVSKAVASEIADFNKLKTSIDSATSSVKEQSKTVSDIKVPSTNKTTSKKNTKKSSSDNSNSSSNNGQKTEDQRVSDAISGYKTLIGLEAEYQKAIASANKNDYQNSIIATYERVKKEIDDIINGLSNAGKAQKKLTDAAERYNLNQSKVSKNIEESQINAAWDNANAADARFDKLTALIDRLKAIQNDPSMKDLSNLTIPGLDGSTQNVEQLIAYMEKIRDLVTNTNFSDKNAVSDIDAITTALGKQVTQVSTLSNRYKNISASKEVANFRYTLTSFVDANSKLLPETKQRIQALIDQLDDLNTVDLNNLRKQFKDIQTEARETGQVGASMADMIADRWKQLGVYLASFVSFNDVIQIFRQGFNYIHQFDDALAEMSKVSDEPLSALKEYQKESFDIASTVGTTGLQLQQATADWQRLGYSIQDASNLAKNANVLLNVSEFDNINDATTALVAMVQAYKDADKDVGDLSLDIIDKLNNIGNNFAVSTDQLATALQDSASALKTTGNDINQSIALITAGNSEVQDASVTGKGIRTIALRLTGTKQAEEELAAMGEETEGLLGTTSKVRDVILEATKVASNGYKGFDILDANGNLKDTYDIMLGIGKIWNEIAETDKKMGRNEQSLLLETVAGKNRANIAASIFENADTLQEVYEASQQSEGSAMEENEKYMDSISGCNGHLLQKCNIKNVFNCWNSLRVLHYNNEEIYYESLIT